MKNYWRILSYAGPLRRLLPLYFLASVLATFFGLVNLSLLIPLLEVLFSPTDLAETLAEVTKPSFLPTLTYLKALFNYYFLNVMMDHGRVSALYFVCIVMIISVLLANLFRYLAAIVAAELSINVVHHLRSTLFGRITQLHLGYFTHQRKGDVMARLLTDVQEVEHALADALRVLCKEPTTLLGFFTVLFYMSPQLTLLALLSLPIVGSGIAALISRLLKRALKSQAALSRLTSMVEETLGGMHTVKALGARDYVTEKFQQENKNYARINFFMFLTKSLVPLLSEFLGVLVLTLLLVYGGQLVLQQGASLPPSTFITYIIIFAQALVPVKSIAKSLSNLQRGLAAAERIFALSDTPPAIASPPSAQPIRTLQHNVTFRAVSFSYDHKPILRGLNLTLTPGKKTALVGPSGSGKSSIVHLLGRFYDVTQGEILIDGLPIQAYDLQALRKLIGVVPPTTILFHDTVFNNIAFGRPEASEAAVTAAAHIAQAHDFIQALPLGYQTVIGGQESKLSSGQVQRLGIARVIVGKPPVLVLDEATAALDSVLERTVQDALDALMQDKALLVIAHRLDTIRNADEILVLDAGGEVVARGTHEALQQQSKLYQQLSTRT